MPTPGERQWGASWPARSPRGRATRLSRSPVAESPDDLRSRAPSSRPRSWSSTFSRRIRCGARFRTPTPATFRIQSAQCSPASDTVGGLQQRRKAIRVPVSGRVEPTEREGPGVCAGGAWVTWRQLLQAGGNSAPLPRAAAWRREMTRPADGSQDWGRPGGGLGRRSRDWEDRGGRLTQGRSVSWKAHLEWAKLGTRRKGGGEAAQVRSGGRG